MKNLLMFIVTTGLLTLAATSQASGDAKAGETKAQACLACHSPTGDAQNPRPPILNGQYEDYLIQAIQAYKNGSRKNPIMAAMVAPLSEQDIKDVAAYFASQQSELHVLKH